MSPQPSKDDWAAGLSRDRLRRPAPAAVKNRVGGGHSCRRRGILVFHNRNEGRDGLLRVRSAKLGDGDIRLRPAAWIA